MDPAQMEEMSKRMQKGRYLFCPNDSHMAMCDDQQTYFDGLIAFHPRHGSASVLSQPAWKPRFRRFFVLSLHVSLILALAFA
jgi:hypothetical protein